MMSPTSKSLLPPSPTRIYTTVIDGYSFDLVKGTQGFLFKSRTRDEVPFKVTFIDKDNFPIVSSADLAKLLTTIYVAHVEKKRDHYEVSFELKPVLSGKRISPKKGPHIDASPQIQKLICTFDTTPKHTTFTSPRQNDPSPRLRDISPKIIRRRESTEGKEHSPTQANSAVSPKKLRKISEEITDGKRQTTTSPTSTQRLTPSKMRGANSFKSPVLQPVLSLSCFPDFSSTKISLKEEISEFLKSDQKSLLLTTETGLNVTAFCKDLQKRLQSENQSSSHHIHHVQVSKDDRQDDTQIISKEVKREQRLTDDEAVVSLQNRDSFVFICENVQHLGINLIERCKLSKWKKVQVIFVCPEHEVSNSKEINSKLFAPLKSNRTGTCMDEFRSAKLSPLDEKEVTSYWKEYPTHKRQIEKLGLKPLLSNPLFLTIVMDKFKPSSTIPDNFFAQVVDEWFIRQEDHSFAGKRFCIDLAKAMPSEVVEYSPPEPDDAELPEFEQFFGKEKTNLLRIAPIRKCGEDEYCFLDDSLRTYFSQL